MNRRNLLQSGAVLLGSLALLRYLPSWLNDEAIADELDSADFEISYTEEEWREILTDEEFAILRKHATERPFSSPLNSNKEAGIYSCAGCEQPLYSSETKFNSGTGWPSFYAAIDNAVATSVDRSFMMVRTEVHCGRCGGHLGHIFSDGPQPTGERHCINGIALNFTAA